MVEQLRGLSTISVGIKKRVEQGDEAGCGIACVAMVTGQTYQRTKRFFREHVFLPTDKKPHTRHYQLRRALEKFGIQTEKRPFRHWRSIDTHAIVPINRQLDGGWHWVVFVREGNRPYILDPALGKERRRYDFRGLNSRGFYIALLGRRNFQDGV
jgi:ABC-type bacteriocin/lantibiotic exporter with double-glycine peptidase domain